MQIAITGSIATDHLMTFPGRFADSLVVEQARQDLAVVPGRGARRAPRRRRGEHLLRHGGPGPASPARRLGGQRLGRLPLVARAARRRLRVGAGQRACGTPPGSSAPPTSTRRRSRRSTPAP
nr:hypothetical protein [Angustibacter aerolatus]